MIRERKRIGALNPGHEQYSDLDEPYATMEMALYAIKEYAWYCWISSGYTSSIARQTFEEYFEAIQDLNRRYR